MRRLTVPARRLSMAGEGREPVDRFLEARVADYMTRGVVSVEPDTPVGELERLFAEHDFNGLPVVEGGMLVGVVTKLDLLRVFAFTPAHMVPPYEELARTPARAIMTRAAVSFAPDVPLTRVLQTLVELRVKSFPVVEGGRLTGVITRGDVVRALNDARAAAAR
jgi:CBS domain-containing protein